MVCTDQNTFIRRQRACSMSATLRESSEDRQLVKAGYVSFLRNRCAKVGRSDGFACRMGDACVFHEEAVAQFVEARVLVVA